MSASARPAELLRPAVHAAMGLNALLLGVLPHWGAVAMAASAILFNWVVLPRTALGRRLERPGEPFLAGLRTYPVAVLFLVLLLPASEAAAAWAILAFGDAAAAIVGRAVPAPRILGRGKATWSGSGAFLLVGGLSAYGMGQAVAALGAHCAWVEVGDAPSWARAGLAALAAGLIDLWRLPPDDNLPCALASGTVLQGLRGLL